MRVLITGTGGYIGSALLERLEQHRIEVWGLRRTPGLEKTLSCDLLDRQAVFAAVSAAGAFDWVIHATALANREAREFRSVGPEANAVMTRNLLDAVGRGKSRPGFIFLSSISVYGEEGRRGPVRVDAELRPSTRYGKSKVDCEALVLQSGLRPVRILRLCPVFDRGNLNNVGKRVYLPGTRLKIGILPAPLYSLCSLETILSKVTGIVSGTDTSAEARIENLCDKEPYSQKDLLNWFPGFALPLPALLMKPAYYLLRLVPGERGRELRGLYLKLFKDNVYAVD